MNQAQVFLQQKATRVLFPGEQGVFEILECHGPIMSILKKGTVYVDIITVPIEKGIMKAMNNEILAVVEFS
jgi:F0F1-type ATP synthase epsilon subunit